MIPNPRKEVRNNSKEKNETNPDLLFSGYKNLTYT